MSFLEKSKIGLDKELKNTFEFNFKSNKQLQAVKLKNLIDPIYINLSRPSSIDLYTNMPPCICFDSLTKLENLLVDYIKN